MKTTIPIIVAALALWSCHSESPVSDVVVSNTDTINGSKGSITVNDSGELEIRTISLDHGFKIELSGYEGYQKFETYTYLNLLRNGSSVLKDSSLTEYEFGDSLYPMVLSLGDDNFELLLEVNDRPSKNYLQLVKVSGNKITGIQKLPTFISQAINLDNDDSPEFAGCWYFSEVYGENGEWTVYNPILYYELRPVGLFLDTTLTIERNKVIYGVFHGFKYREDIKIKTKESKMQQEIDRIEQIAKKLE